MKDLTILHNLLANANQKNVSDLPVEEYFDQIVSCIEQEKIDEAAKMIESVFAKGAPDVRLIFYYYYTLFAKHGIKSFREIFPSIISLIQDYQNILLPLNKTDKHIQSSLSWLISHLLFKIKYYEKLYASGKVHPIWKKSVLDLSAEELEPLIDIANQFRKFFLEQWPKSPSKDKIVHLVKKIEDLKSFVFVSEEPQKSATLEPVEVASAQLPLNPIELDKPMNEEFNRQDLVATKQSDNQSRETGLSAQKNTREKDIFVNIPVPETNVIGPESSVKVTPAITSTGTVDGLKNSISFEKLNDFTQKLHIFEALIDKNDYLKAAVVAKDIDHMIEAFDPLTYFPKLFASYFALFARHVVALADQYDKRESLQVKALEKLYRTDLDTFIEW